MDNKNGFFRVPCEQDSDRVSEAEIADGLNTRLFGKAGYYYFEETGSTNHEAALLAEQQAPEGTVVIANHQTRGKGRNQRSWFSPAGGGIYLSLILRPAIPPTGAPKLSLLAAVAAAETLISLTKLEVLIKWPNDLLVRGKKIAGILAEMSGDAHAVNHVIVGIGINVNTAPGSFPGDIRDNATSVLAETGAPCQRSRVVRALLEHLEFYYSLFLTEGFERILSRWKELSRIKGREIQVDGSAGTLSGTVVGVDEEGALLLKDDAGVIHRILSGDLILPPQTEAE